MLPAATALVAEIAPPGRQGEYAGLFTASFSVAFAVAPGLGLHVLGLHGPAWLFGSCFALCFVAAAVLLALRREPQAGATEPAAAPLADVNGEEPKPAAPATA
jgi:MFS family permease